MRNLPRIPTVTLRRALLFLADIGTPFIVGMLLHSPAAALLGCVSGLLFSFADQEGPLRARYTILLVVAAAIAVGGGAGLILRGFPWPVWLLFSAGTFASGAFLGVGKAPALGARFFSMALVVTSGAPTIEILQLWGVAAAFLTAAPARAIDHLLCGPLPHLRGGVPRRPEHNWIRFAVAYAAASTASLWVGLAIDPGRALWVVVTALVVMQPDSRASYVRIVERTVGTAVGVAAAFAVASITQSPLMISVAILVLAPLIPHHLQHRYWLHTALIALLVLLAYDLAAEDTKVLHELFLERLEDMLIGCGVALIGTFAAFPRRAPAEPDDLGRA